MDRSFVYASLIVFLAVLLPSVHVALSVLLWRRLRFVISLLLQVGLSLLTFVVWFVVSILLEAFTMWSSDGGIHHDVFFWTFGLLLYPCSKFPQLRDSLTNSLCGSPSFVAGPLFFLTLSLSAMQVILLSGRIHHRSGESAV